MFCVRFAWHEDTPIKTHEEQYMIQAHTHKDTIIDKQTVQWTGTFYGK